MKKSTKHIRLLAIILSVSLGCLFLLPYLKKPDKTSKNIAIITSEDRTILEAFFKELLLKDRFAYVLLGCKPMALAIFHDSMPEDIESDHNQTLKRGWETWQKYQHLFSYDNFIFRVFEDPQSDIKHLILINSKNFSNEMHLYPQELNLLTQNTDLSVWLKNIEKTSQSFEECFQRNHILKGIAFGYGKHNSQMFQKKWDLFNVLEKQYPNQDADFLNEQYEKLDYKVALSLLQDEDCEAKKYIMLPIFAADLGHEETQELHKRYAQDREMIIKTLSKRPFLEVVLENFSSLN